MSKTAYISSTYRDLKSHRQAVYRALRKIHYDVVCMEDYVATDERNVDKCRAHARSCDIYIGIFGHRYGFVPANDNPDGASITEMEYRAARTNGRVKVRTFLLDGDVPAAEIDAEDETHRLKLKSLREEISRHSYGPFRTEADLTEQVLASVYTAEAQARVEAGLDSVQSARTMSLEDSGLLMITDTIQAAIEKSGSVAAMQVGLGSGDAWWSTRLYLVAALLEEYTSIPGILFLSQAPGPMAVSGDYLGICSPTDVRRALAGHFRDVDRAYRASLPERVFDAVEEVPRVVSRFAGKVGALSRGGEEKVMQWVAPHVVQQWRGFHAGRLEMANRKLDSAVVDEIIATRMPYVALVRNGQFDCLVDRVELATNVALGRR